MSGAAMTDFPAESTRPTLPAMAFGGAALLGGLAAVHAPRAMAPVAALAAILCLVHLVRARRMALLWVSGIGGLLAALLAWSFASVIWGLDGAPLLERALRKAPILALLIPLLAMSSGLRDAERRWLAGALAAGFACLLLLLAIELASGGFLLRSIAPENLRNGTWRDVAVGRGLVIMALMVWPAMMALARRGTWAALAAFLAAAVLALTGGHDATRLALVAGAVAFALAHRFGRRGVLALGIACAAFILAAPLLSLGPLSPDLATQEGWPRDQSAMHRLYIWQFATERIAERPILGWGMGSSRYLPGGDAMTPTGGPAMSLHPHSAPLQLWLELGIAGVLIAAAMVLRGAVLLARADAGRLQRAAGAGALAAAFAVASVGFGLWQSWWLATLGLTASWCAALLREPPPSFTSAGAAPISPVARGT